MNASAQTWARAGGLLYLVIIVIGLLGEGVVRAGLVVPGDPEATAQRIVAAEPLWRLGVAGQFLLLVCALAMAVVWYVLLRPVHRRLALAMLCFALVSLAVESVCALLLQAALLPLSGAAYLKGVDPRQLHLWTYLAVSLHAQAFGLALLFFGVQCLIAGYLIRQSGYLPGWLGTAMQVAGACYIVNTVSMALSPALQAMLFPLILMPPLLAESAFCLWLLFKGVDGAAWQRRAAPVMETHGRAIIG